MIRRDIPNCSDCGRPVYAELSRRRHREGHGPIYCGGCVREKHPEAVARAIRATDAVKFGRGRLVWRRSDDGQGDEG